MPRLPLLFLHGAGGVSQVWQHQLLAFPTAKAADLPGRGGPPLPAGRSTVDAYLAAVRARAVGRAPRVLVGHSLGAAIALAWAAAAPDEVQGLALLGLCERLPVPAAVWEALRSGDPRQRERLTRWWFGPTASARLREKARAALAAMPREVLLADFGAAARFDASAALDRLATLPAASRIPALLLIGEADALTPPDCARRLHARLPASSLVVVQDAGHLAMLEQPRAVNAALRAFVDGLEAAA
ncbi:MAG: alpha/beta fold hydrolase [Armatimonadota bacterium]|nr:alpha/beta fold hydrolase [Armatimonadota bacterium]